MTTVVIPTVTGAIGENRKEQPDRLAKRHARKYVRVPRGRVVDEAMAEIKEAKAIEQQVEVEVL